MGYLVNRSHTMATLLVVAVIISILINSSVTQDHPVACINSNACINGTTIPSTDLDDAFEAFFGIPYAQPPTGNLRFAVSKIKSRSNT